MASSYTSLLKFNKPALGDAGWGTSVNGGFTDMVEQALTGALSVAVTSGGTTTVPAIADGVSSDARNQFITITGSLTSVQTATVQLPAGTSTNFKLYFVKNSAGGTVTVTTAAGTNVAVPNGASMILRVTNAGVETTMTHATSLTLGTALAVASGGTGVTTSTGSGNNVLSVSPTLTDPAVTSLNGGQLAGLRNRFINGNMAIDQRNSGNAQTFNNATPSGDSYSIDRWFVRPFGPSGAITGQRVTVGSGNVYRYQFTGAAGSGTISFGQRIEAASCADLAGTTVTLSVDLANSLLTTVTWQAFYPNTTDVYPSYGANRTSIASGTFTVTSTVARYSTQISIPAAAVTGLEIIFSVTSQTSGTWTIGAAQLEPGSVATPLEQRPYGLELTLCQRYYAMIAYMSGVSSTVCTMFVSGVYSNQPAGSTLVGTLMFPVYMRAAPSYTIVTGMPNYTFRGYNASGAMTVFTTASASTAFVSNQNAVIIFSSTSSTSGTPATGDPFSTLTVSAGSAMSVGFTAEL